MIFNSTVATGDADNWQGKVAKEASEAIEEANKKVDSIGTMVVTTEGYNDYISLGAENSFGEDYTPRRDIIIGYYNHLSSSTNGYNTIIGYGHDVSSVGWVHVEGYSNHITNGEMSHIEGHSNYGGAATFGVNHMEGYDNRLWGLDNEDSTYQETHVEGRSNNIKGRFVIQNHIEGYYNEFYGSSLYQTHLEGVYNRIYSQDIDYSHIEGRNHNISNRLYTCHIEGYYHELNGNQDLNNSHIEGGNNRINTTGNRSSYYNHIEGYNNVFSGGYSTHMEGSSNQITSDSYNVSDNHIEGSYNRISSKEFYCNNISGSNNNIANNSTTYSHVGGYQNQLYGDSNSVYASDIDGYYNQIKTTYESRIEGGYNNINMAEFSHVEGYSNQVNNLSRSHVEGQVNIVDKLMDGHVEGAFNHVDSQYGHVEGAYNTLYGKAAHAEGMGNNQTSVHVEKTFPILFRNDENGTRTSSSISVYQIENEDTIWLEIKNLDNYASSNYTYRDFFNELSTNYQNCYIEAGEDYFNITSVSKDDSYIKLTLNENFPSYRDYCYIGIYDRFYTGTSLSSYSNYTLQVDGVTVSKWAPYGDYYFTALGITSSKPSVAKLTGNLYPGAHGDYSHSEGLNSIALGEAQHVEGKNNLIDTEGKYAHIIGNGEDANNRSNAMTVDWDGNLKVSGTITDGDGNVLGGGGSSTLAGLDDVNIESPTNGQALVYNEETEKFENGDVAQPEIFNTERDGLVPKSVEETDSKYLRDDGQWAEPIEVITPEYYYAHKEELEASGLTYLVQGTIQGTTDAKTVGYDNTGSGLQSTNVQDAIDELALNKNISDAWNSTIAYTVGKYAIYENKLYRCIVANANVQPSTNPTYWSETNIGNEINSTQQTIDYSQQLKNTCSQSLNYCTAYKIGKTVFINLFTSSFSITSKAYTTLWNNNFPIDIRPNTRYARFSITNITNGSGSFFYIDKSSGLGQVWTASGGNCQLQITICYLTE